MADIALSGATVEDLVNELAGRAYINGEFLSAIVVKHGDSTTFPSGRKYITDYGITEIRTREVLDHSPEPFDADAVINVKVRDRSLTITLDVEGADD